MLSPIYTDQSTLFAIQQQLFDTLLHHKTILLGHLKYLSKELKFVFFYGSLYQLQSVSLLFFYFIMKYVREYLLANVTDT